MKTYPRITEIENGCNLYNCDNVNLNFQFKNSNRVLVKGIVTNPQNCPIANAAVEIIKVNSSTKKEVVLGVVFTECDGKYAVSLSVVHNFFYKLNVYSPS